MSDQIETKKVVWQRFSNSDRDAMSKIESITGLRLGEFQIENFSELSAESPIYRIRFTYPFNGKKMESQVLFFVERDFLISLEPDPVPNPLEQAYARITNDSRDNDTYDAFAVILQTLADSSDDLIDSMNDDVSKGLVQSTSVLETLDAKGKDFGVTDVVQTQLLLSSIEDTLSRCAENLLLIGLIARRADAHVPKADSELHRQYQTLQTDIQAIEGDVDFLHERVRFLQLVNEAALSTKQNQIIKVFTVMAAVFLPALLVSTYYSMNLEVLPLLNWPYGEPVTLIFTLFLAFLPIIYVKQRGWLR